MQHLLLHLPYEARMGGLCSTVGAIQLRDVRRFFERNAKINAKINAKFKLQLQSHIFWRRCQTSQPNTMVRSFPACIIHPLVTMLAIMNRVSAFPEDNLEVQVMRGTRPWTMKSGAVSCYTCWPTFPRWSRTLRKFSTLFPLHEFLLHEFTLFSIQPPLSCLIQVISSTILASLKGSNPDGNGESS